MSTRHVFNGMFRVRTKDGVIYAVAAVQEYLELPDEHDTYRREIPGRAAFRTADSDVNDLGNDRYLIVATGEIAERIQVLGS